MKSRVAPASAGCCSLFCEHQVDISLEDKDRNLCHDLNLRNGSSQTLQTSFTRKLDKLGNSRCRILRFCAINNCSCRYINFVSQTPCIWFQKANCLKVSKDGGKTCTESLVESCPSGSKWRKSMQCSIDPRPPPQAAQPCKCLIWHRCI